MDDDLKAYLLRCYRYNPGTGVIKNFHGKIVNGGLNHGGYLRISVRGKTILLHRLAWLLTSGLWPKNDIDHRDGVRTNNKLTNLREATRGENHQNRRVQKNTKSGLLGAFTTSGGRGKPWKSIITKDGVRHSLGSFDTAMEAHLAYLDAKKRLHDFQPEPRKAAGARTESQPRPQPLHFSAKRLNLETERATRRCL